MGEWITFEEAAEIAGITVGELCSVLSQSGSCSDPTNPDDSSKPPAHPSVRVILDRTCIPYSIDEQTTFAFPTVTAHGVSVVVINSRGAVGVNRVNREDLVAWLARQSADMLSMTCPNCGGTGSECANEKAGGTRGSCGPEMCRCHFCGGGGRVRR